MKKVFVVVALAFVAAIISEIIFVQFVGSSVRAIINPIVGIAAGFLAAKRIHVS